MSREPHQPTSKSRNMVTIAKATGILEATIAKMLDIDRKTLKKYYGKELSHGSSDLNTNIAGALYNKAISGDTTAMIFWLKCRARWSEKAGEADNQSQALPSITVNVKTPDRLKGDE